jgi:GNAT superfamily N-acetyltransferase
MTTIPTVCELREAHRPGLISHFRSLGAADRHLRFCSALGDDALRAYVERIDFDRDAVFGAFNRHFELVAAAHVARAGGHAEVGLSVLPGYRRLGIGSALLCAAMRRALSWGMDAVLVHCLPDNHPMMSLARKRGFRIESANGEADAWLRLPCAPAGNCDVRAA